MRSEYVSKNSVDKLLDYCTYRVSLIAKMALCSGLRISDILNIKTKDFSQKMEITEQKTGKIKVVELPRELYKKINNFKGKKYVFQSPRNWKKPLTRQAVYIALFRAKKHFKKLKNKVVSPHSLRKIYAVEKLKNGASVAEIQKELNHTYKFVTLLYALSNKKDFEKLL